MYSQIYNYVQRQRESTHKGEEPLSLHSLESSSSSFSRMHFFRCPRPNPNRLFRDKHSSPVQRVPPHRIFALATATTNHRNGSLGTMHVQHVAAHGVLSREDGVTDRTDRIAPVYTAMMR